jgi:hypothetical protein
MGRFEAFTILGLFGFLLILFVMYLAVNNDQKTSQIVDMCSEAGGVSIIGYRGHFKVCIEPNAVIKLPQEGNK